jgi:mRNA-degrading endonuclease toxin of MazEF toxin-antitoxin module
VGLAVRGGRLVVEPQQRPRYTLAELLVQCNPKARRSKEEREWLDDQRAGGELILVVSPEAFNRVTKVPVVLPITGGANLARTPVFAVTLESAGTKTTGIVRCDQPRVLDLGARGGKKVESVPDAIVEEVLARRAPVFE